MRRAALALPAVAALAAGCGSSSSIGPRYAGATRDGAREIAMSALSAHIAQRGSALYHHHLRFVRVRPGRGSDGKKVWVVVVEDRDNGSRICVSVEKHTFGDDVTAVVCGVAKRKPQPPPPAV